MTDTVNRAPGSDVGGTVERIAAIDAFPTRLPLRKPLAGSAGPIASVDVLFLRVLTVGGAEGWGEAIADPGNTGEVVDGMRAMLSARIGPTLVGRGVSERATVMASLRGAIHANRAVLAATEMALLDLEGLLRGMPVVDLLGGARRDRAPLIAIIGSAVGSPLDAVDEAAEQHALGIRAFKLKVGTGKVDQDIDRLRRVRAVIGDSSFLAADANMAWDVDTALRFARAGADVGLDCLEQPTTKHHGRMRAVGTRSAVRMAADEAIHGSDDLLALGREGAISGASLKAIKLGGITQAVSLASLADACGLSVGLAMMMESGLATTAMVHAACAVPQLDWFLNAGVDFLDRDPVSAFFERQSGTIRLHRQPGLGVRVTEHMIRR